MRMNVAIVDDVEINLTLFRHLIARVGGEVVPHCFSEPLPALAWCAENPVDIVIVDYMMPEVDGIEFIRRLRQLPDLDNIPVVMVTASNQAEVRYAALEAGATDFLGKPVDKNEFIARLRNMAQLRGSQRLLRDRAALLASEVAAATETIVERERETIFRLSRAAEYRDPETGAHILRMAHYSRLIAGALGLPPEEQQLVFEAAPMHDIGKVGTPDMILLKPGRLDPDEFTIMKRHARVGYDILRDSTSPILQAAAAIALAHHEKFDGSGYPQGLAGEAIPLHGRIVAVADVFDALTSERPYKTAWPLDRALSFLREQSGQHFDPACVEAFMSRLDDILAIRAAHADDPVTVEVNEGELALNLR